MSRLTSQGAMSTDVITLRSAGPGDLAAVAALLASAKLPADGLDEQFGPQYVVAVVADEIIGAEGIERYGDTGLLRSAVVSDRWRGRGVGDLLTKNRLAWASEQHLRELWLLTTTAEGWFPRYGFAAADRSAAPPEMQQSREFRDACPSSATAMRLVL
jgi:amino-acid N-acetyltransferase